MVQELCAFSLLTTDGRADVITCTPAGRAICFAILFVCVCVFFLCVFLKSDKIGKTMQNNEFFKIFKKNISKNGFYYVLFCSVTIHKCKSSIFSLYF